MEPEKDKHDIPEDQWHTDGHGYTLQEAEKLSGWSSAWRTAKKRRTLWIAIALGLLSLGALVYVFVN